MYNIDLASSDIGTVLDLEAHANLPQAVLCHPVMTGSIGSGHNGLSLESVHSPRSSLPYPQSMTNAPKKKRVDDPPTSDPAHKPILLQRRRVWRACESCRRKKIKCDGNEPTCSQCSTAGSNCTWLQTKDRAALSRHYVQELESRLLHMESLFAQIAPSIGQSTIASAGLGSNQVASTSKSSNAVNTAIPKSAATYDRADASSPTSSSSSFKVDDDFSESFGQLALDEHGHMRWIGGSSTMSLIQSFRALTASPPHRLSPMEEDPHAPGPSANKLYFPASVFFGKVHALPGAEEAEYPERDLADKLVDAYFARFHFLMPVLDKPSFLQQYTVLMDNTHDIALARTEAAFMSLVFAVFACAARLVDDPRLATGDNFDDGGMGMVYYERALILHYISHASTQILHVQSFILMSSFLCSINCLPQAWLLVGQAVRFGQDLGLHRSPRRLLLTHIEKETRRKIWWGLYSLDRMLALALGRPLGVEDSDCDVEFPVPYDDEELPAYFSGAHVTQPYPSLMAGFVSLTTLYQIAGRVLRKVYALDVCREQLELEKKAELQRDVELLDQELTRWLDALPLVFKSQGATEKQVSMAAVLCSHYYSVLTTLHRNFLPIKNESPIVAKSVLKALPTARSCIRLASHIRNVVPTSHHLAFFIQLLFSSAVILLLYAMHAPDPRTATAAMEEAKSCLPALESWEGHWPGARKCKELLIELANTANDKIKPPNESRPSVPTLAQAGLPQKTERRRSVTLAAPSPQSPNRAVKTPRHRRTASRDTSTTRRHLASPYRVEPAQRARSSSRRRVAEGIESSQGLNRALSDSHHSPPAVNSSPHSSPGSRVDPSPKMSSAEQVAEPSQQNVPLPYKYSNIPISPVSATQEPHFSYDYALQSDLPIQPHPQTWGFRNGDHDDTDMMSPTNREQGTSYLAALSYDDTPYFSTPTGYPMFLSTPPSSSFPVSGLPFSGLDFLRNYNSYPANYGQNSLWQAFDERAFGYDPELPFSLGDFITENQSGEG